MRQKSEQQSLPSGLSAAIVKAASLARIGITVSVTNDGQRHSAYVSDAALHLAEADSIHVISSSAVVDGNEVSIDFCFERDDRNRARKLEESKTRFRGLLDLAPEGVAILVPERIEYGNPALLRLLGYSELAPLTRSALSQHLHPVEHDWVLTSVRELMQRGGSLGPLEVRARRSDGSYASMEVVAILADWEDRPAVLAIARDLGQRRQLKSQLLQADRLTALGTLAAGVAHEINNPLAYVLLNLQYLLREIPKFSGDPARLATFLDRLNEARHGTERVGTIVRDLRAFARTDQETTSAVDMRRVLGSSLRMANAQIEAAARVIEQYDPVPLVLGNAARLEQVFVNLLVNAAQAFADKDPSKNQIRLALKSEGQTVVAEVRDNGPGIESALLGRVFDPFFTTKPGVGTGLGLPICHNIVRRLGGEITVQSTPGEGTAFRVSLPARPSMAVLKESKTTPLPWPVVLKRARVLVIDDELPLAAMLARVLGDEHDVVIATSAREAIEHIETGPQFDVLLCDLLMPGMSGMDLYRALAQRGTGVEARMVFMTGGAFTARPAEFLANVPNQWLEKPFDLNQLRRLVRKLSRPSQIGARP